MQGNWRLGYLAREAALNVFGRSSRMLPLVVLAVLAGVGSSAFSAVESVAFRASLDELAELGRGVVLFGAAPSSPPASIDRASCEAPAAEPGVERAGLAIRGGFIDVSPIGANLPTMRASTTLFPALTTADIVIGYALGHAFTEGSDETFSVLARGAEDTTLAVVGSDDVDALGANSVILLPLQVTDTHGEQCVVMFDELADTAHGLAAYGSQLSAAGSDVTGYEVLPDAVSPISAYLNRPGRFLPLLLGLMGAIAAGIGYRLRASEIAVYRLSGSEPAAVLALMTIEVLLVAGTALASSVAAALVLAWAYRDPTVAMLGGVVLAGTWAVLTIGMCFDLALRRPTDLAKDR